MRTLLFKSGLATIILLVLGALSGGFHFWNSTASSLLVAHAASLTVTNTNDSGPGSLRQAIADAQAGDTITFASGLHGQTISLTSGQLAISRDLTINGPGAGQLTISAGGLSRVFVVNAGVTATIAGLTVRDGSFAGMGAGILIDGGTLTLNNSQIMDNSSYYGGGVFNGGELTVNDSIFDGNSVTRPDTSILNGAGGAIFNLGNLTINRSVFSANSAVIRGGAIYNDSLGRMNVNHSSFSGNSVNSVGGGIATAGTLIVENSSFHANTASQGGGIQSSNTLTVRNSTFDQNSAPSGGGGIYAGIGTLSVVNSTFSANTANFGGGLYNGAGNGNQVNNSTFSDNSGSGIYDDGGLFLTNTIIANSTSGLNCNSASGSIGIGNLSWPDTSCPGSLNADPKLLPLADNGGPTLTMALDTGSAAIDAGSDSYCAVTDQRGAPRPQIGAHCDIGAYEFSSIAPTPTPTLEPSQPAPTETPMPTDTPVLTGTPTDTPLPTDTTFPTDTPVDTLTPTATSIGTVTNTPASGKTTTPRPTNTPNPTKTPRR